MGDVYLFDEPHNPADVVLRAAGPAVTATELRQAGSGPLRNPLPRFREPPKKKKKKRLAPIPVTVAVPVWLHVDEEELLLILA